jgi:hypothetical protein
MASRVANKVLLTRGNITVMIPQKLEIIRRSKVAEMKKKLWLCTTVDHQP